eukprot:3300193-Amphidinium_carterae.1
MPCVPYPLFDALGIPRNDVWKSYLRRGIVLSLTHRQTQKDVSRYGHERSPVCNIGVHTCLSPPLLVVVLVQKVVCLLSKSEQGNTLALKDLAFRGRLCSFTFNDSSLSNAGQIEHKLVMINAEYKAGLIGRIQKGSVPSVWVK